VAMIELPVVDQRGEQVDSCSVDENALGGRVRKQVMFESVLMYEARKRRGSACAKTRSEVAGSSHKPWRQKGTGHARSGSKKSPLWRGGGTIFGPKPRDFSYSIPKKARRAALRSALLAKFQDGEAIVVDKIELAAPKTREMAQVLDNLGIRESCLLVLPDHDATIWRCARNIPTVRVVAVRELNAYDVLRQHRLVLLRESLDQIAGAQ